MHSKPPPAFDSIDRFDALCNEVPIRAAEHLSRDELHDRNEAPPGGPPVDRPPGPLKSPP